MYDNIWLKLKTMIQNSFNIIVIIYLLPNIVIVLFYIILIINNLQKLNKPFLGKHWWWCCDFCITLVTVVSFNTEKDIKKSL